MPWYWTAILWSPVIFTTQSLFLDTVLLHAWPHQTFIADCLRRGDPPLWNPFIAFGHPIWANPQTFPGNPLATLFHHWTFATGLRATLLLDTLFGAAGAWLAARRLGLPGRGAWLAALVYSGNGFFILHTGFLSNLGGLAILPWLFVPDLRTRLGIVAAGLTGALLLLGGHPQITLYALFLRVLLPPRAPLGRWAAASALAVVMTAAHLLPAANLYPSLGRASGLSYDAARDCSLPPARAVGFAALPLWNRYLPPPEEDLRIIGFSVGAAALPFLARGAAASPAGLAGLAAAGVVLAVGRYGPVFPAVWRHIPLLAGFRHPAQALAIPVALAAWWIGRGAARTGRRAAGGWSALIAVELAAFAWTATPTIPDAIFTAPTPAMARLERSRSGYLYMPPEDWAHQIYPGGTPLENWLAYRDALYPSGPAARGIPEAASLEPVETAAHARFLETLRREGPAGALARDAAITHIATFRAAAHPALVEERGAPAYLYRHTAARPMHRVEPAGPGAAVRVEDAAAHRIRFLVNAPRPAALVTAGSWDAGWRLAGPEGAVPYARAYGNLRAAPVPRGTSERTAVYRAPGAAAGLAITVLALLVLIAGFLLSGGPTARLTRAPTTDF